MPANLSPEYKAAEETFRKAKTKEEKLAALEEMLAVIPKHKGTEKLQAEIRKRLSKLRAADEQKGGSGPQFNPYLVEPQGAGQVVLVGFPNVGKSTLVGRLTNAKTEAAEYPFSTGVPIPGMMPFRDILIQLVDTPPITEEGIPGPLMATLQNADAFLVMIDASSDDCLSQLTETVGVLQQRRLVRAEVPEGVRALTMDQVLLAANKSDAEAAADNLALITELWDGPALLPISAAHGQGLHELGEHCFRVLDIIRVYTKAPGKDPDMEVPFVLKRGSTVLDLAEQIHKEVAENLKGAKLWGTSAKFDGQNAALEHVLEDGDIVELKA